MTDLVDMGQGVYHGYPQALRFQADDGSWEPWMGNEIFTEELATLVDEEWEKLPMPPKLFEEVYADPWGRLMCAKSQEEKRVHICDVMV